jgi:hypothetical protein
MSKQQQHRDGAERTTERGISSVERGNEMLDDEGSPGPVSSATHHHQKSTCTSLILRHHHQHIHHLKRLPVKQAREIRFFTLHTMTHDVKADLN